MEDLFNNVVFKDKDGKEYTPDRGLMTYLRARHRALSEENRYKECIEKDLNIDWIFRKGIALRTLNKSINGYPCDYPGISCFNENIPNINDDLEKWWSINPQKKFRKNKSRLSLTEIFSDIPFDKISDIREGYISNKEFHYDEYKKDLENSIKTPNPDERFKKIKEVLDYRIGNIYLLLKDDIDKKYKKYFKYKPLFKLNACDLSNNGYVTSLIAVGAGTVGGVITIANTNFFITNPIFTILVPFLGGLSGGAVYAFLSQREKRKKRRLTSLGNEFRLVLSNGESIFTRNSR